MIDWNLLAGVFNPHYWFTWLWSAGNGVSTTVLPVASDGDYYITKDTCAKCNRFLSWHSKNSGYCSFHNVSWEVDTAKHKAYELFKNTFEMWLRSRCGGDIDEARINSYLLTLSSFLDFAATHSQTNGNRYDFCDDSFCDYQMVYEFLIDLRQQAQDRDNTMVERHTIDTELRICEALQRFIEFRKFQLPIKGIVENRFSATERVLSTYRYLLMDNQRATIDLTTSRITYTDIKETVTHFQHPYNMITSYLHQCQNVRSMENDCDIEFATSFVCAYLYSVMPQHVAFLHMVRVRDLCLDGSAAPTWDERRHQQTEVMQYVSNSWDDLPSPAVASACIGQLQKLRTIDEETRAVLDSYISYIRPRITKSNDYLLLNVNALGLNFEDVQERITTLVYRVTGKVTELVDRLERDPPSTPALPRVSGKRNRPRSSRKERMLVRFNRLVSRKVVKRYRKTKVQGRRRLVLDLSKISAL